MTMRKRDRGGGKASGLSKTALPLHIVNRGGASEGRREGGIVNYNPFAKLTTFTLVEEKEERLDIN